MLFVMKLYKISTSISFLNLGHYRWTMMIKKKGMIYQINHPIYLGKIVGLNLACNCFSHVDNVITNSF